MTVLLFLATILSLLVLAAHFLYWNNLLLVALALAALGLLAIRRKWARIALQVILILAALEWIATAYGLAETRIAEGRKYFAAMVILGSVTVVNLLAVCLLAARRARDWFRG